MFDKKGIKFLIIFFGIIVSYIIVAVALPNILGSFMDLLKTLIWASVVFGIVWMITHRE